MTSPAFYAETMQNDDADAKAVKAANRCLYDAVAVDYETLDGRRSTALARWLRNRMADIRQHAPGSRLLDLGAGSGLASRCSLGIFTRRIAIDISPRIMAAHSSNFDFAVVGDVELLPFCDAAFDAVVCFAVLHHLPRFVPMVAEISRVLAPGGIFYADHDMDMAFARRFGLFLRIYRFLRRSRAKYRRFVQDNGAVYDLAERHAQGIDTPAIAALFAERGFDVEVHYHWYGLTPWTDLLFGAASRQRGLAPLAAMLCRKRDGLPGKAAICRNFA